MQPTIYHTEQSVSVSPEEAFAFFADPYNLEKITPPWLHFKILRLSTPVIERGTVIDYRLRLHGIGLHWQSVIREWQPPYYFVDEQLKGPYAKWHHLHEIDTDTEAARSGARISDTVTYTLPGGVVGRLFAGWYVHRDVERIFTYRQAAITQILDPATTQEINRGFHQTL